MMSKHAFICRHALESGSQSPIYELEKEMLDLATIHSTLSELQERFSDGRIHLCRLEAVDITTSQLTLRGEVLDQTTLTAVETGLAARLPGIAIDSSAVQLLRTPQPAYLVVASNVTEFYARPSFLAERHSTVLNGTVGELLREEGNWAFVRLMDGYLGWLYRPYLADYDPQQATRSTHLVRVPFAMLRQQPQESAPPRGRVLAGSYVTLETAENGWAEISLAGGTTGYLLLDELCALEALPVGAARRTQMMQDALHYVGVPYLWGGGTILGIDCSGFAQLLHRLAGVTIPRDADMQYLAGQPVERPFAAGDLLFFGGKGGHREISHVGVSLGSDRGAGEWGMIHASRGRNGVYVDDVAAVESLRERFVGARSFL
jgi:cell wall-associated NlpC family hydrolase